MLDKDAPILLIEDDRVDVMTVQRALKKNKVSREIKRKKKQKMRRERKVEFY